MIIKPYDIYKINLNDNPFILFYGTNEGAKDESINKLLSSSSDVKILRFDEKQIIENYEIFYNEISSRSLFETKKIIIIKRGSDKLLKIIEYTLDKKLEDVCIIINAPQLEKKSKLRSIFEKHKNLTCAAFYPDTLEILSKLALNFFKEKKVSISQSNVNYLVDKCNGDRGLLKNELNKIEAYLSDKKKLNIEDMTKLINLGENHSVGELIDNCLAKNQGRTIKILNENIFTNEDCILIIRTFLNKSKRILKLAIEYRRSNNINQTLLTAKPPIFWKDKEIIKQQLSKWTPENIKKLIYKLNEIELLLKKNINNSTNLIRDFILQYSS